MQVLFFVFPKDFRKTRAAISGDSVFCGFFGFMPCILYFALCFFAGLWYNV